MEAAPKTYILMFNGERVNEKNTPKELEMDDFAVLEASVRQEGGGVTSSLLQFVS
jgi:hypothetical protein